MDEGVEGGQRKEKRETGGEVDLRQVGVDVTVLVEGNSETRTTKLYCKGALERNTGALAMENEPSEKPNGEMVRLSPD